MSDVLRAVEEVEAVAEDLRKADAEWSAKSGIKLPYWQSLAVAVMPAIISVTDDGNEALIQDLNLINCGVEASEAYKRVLARDARQRAEINRLKGNDNG